MSGYSQTELEDAQAKWGLRFPPDLVALLRERRSVIVGDDFDWIRTPDEAIGGMLSWPLEGFLFDVRNGLWWPDWGERPLSEDAAAEKFRAIFAAAPKLIPVFGHRYLPEEPHEAGNPIFSVYQMDVIIYGTDLANYVERELTPSVDGSCPQPDWPNVKPIRFWTRSVAFNDERFAQGGGFAFFNKGGALPEGGA